MNTFCGRIKENSMSASNPLPCYVTKYERIHSCPCELFVSTAATVSVMISSAGMAVTVWCRWTRDMLQKCRDRVIIGIMSGSLTYSSENAIIVWILLYIILVLEIRIGAIYDIFRGSPAKRTSLRPIIFINFILNFAIYRS